MSRKISTRADRTWRRLKSWYGARLAEQYGPTPPEDWCTLIDRIDDERLERALQSVRGQSPQYPPTLGQLETAIPKRDLSPGQRKSIPEKLCQFAIDKLGRALCRHQVARPWNYFGRGFAPGEIPEWRGVQIPACEECGTPSHRVLVDEMTEHGVVAA